jgi:transcriptional regulator with XRE-family HTH domain
LEFTDQFRSGNFQHWKGVGARSSLVCTGKALAEKANLAQDTVSRLERELHDPEEGSVAAFATALDYPEGYFYLDDPADLDEASVSFRSLSKMSVEECDAALSAGSLGLQLCQWVEDRFALPRPDLPDLSYEADPEAAAVALLRCDLSPAGGSV